MAITITYYGHACFKVDNGNELIVFDPYSHDSVPGLKLSDNIEANIVSCSHQHGDHNAAQLIHVNNNPYSFTIEKLKVPHDDANGALRGFSDITMVNMDDTRIVHFGDIGRLLTDSEYKTIVKADIVMIPVGGHYTIDALQAKQIIDKLQPQLTILMHYRQGNIGYDVLQDIEDIKHIFTTLQQKNDCTYTYHNENLRQIITLQPKQN